MTTLPRDNDNNAIQALRLNPNGAHRLNASSSSIRNSNPFKEDTRIVSVYATGPAFINFGDATVTADSSDHYYPTGLYYDFAIGGGKTLHYTHIAVMAAEADCIIYLSEKH